MSCPLQLRPPDKMSIYHNQCGFWWPSAGFSGFSGFFESKSLLYLHIHHLLLPSISRFPCLHGSLSNADAENSHKSSSSAPSKLRKDAEEHDSLVVIIKLPLLYAREHRATKCSHRAARI